MINSLRGNQYCGLTANFVLSLLLCVILNEGNRVFEEGLGGKRKADGVVVDDGLGQVIHGSIASTLLPLPVGMYVTSLEWIVLPSNLLRNSRLFSIRNPTAPKVDLHKIRKSEKRAVRYHCLGRCDEECKRQPYAG